jgi:hypothetical protein
MEEIDEFTMSGKTIDFLRREVVEMLRHCELNDQQHMELVNLAEALKAPTGFRVTFEFSYNS